MIPRPGVPYVVGQWVRGEKFYGREKLIVEILDGPRNSSWVLGTRQIGKTSLLASEFHDEGVHFTIINMPLVRTPMIAPTRIYEYAPALEVDEAVELAKSFGAEQGHKFVNGRLDKVAQELRAAEFKAKSK